jgi:hypothetical protein
MGSSILIFSVFAGDFCAVGRQNIIPETIEVTSQLLQPLAANEIKPSRAAWLDLNQSGTLQNLEVLRHGWPADRLCTRKLNDGFLAAA